MTTEKAERPPSIINLPFVESLHADYVVDPNSVPEDWRQYFAALEPDPEFAKAPRLGPSFKPGSVFNPSNGFKPSNGHAGPSVPAKLNGHGNGTAEAWPLNGRVHTAAVLQDRVDALVRAYRVRGHMVANIDPLGLPRPSPRELDPGFYDLTPEDYAKNFPLRTLSGVEVLTLRQIIERLSHTYCRSIGVQYMHMDDLDVKNWLLERMESTENRLTLTRDEQLRILTKLTDGVIFEEFIQKKFLKAKSFSLEGCESLLPLLAFAIERAAEHGVDEIVLGMAHRGRLNVLANIMGKSPREIFREFEDRDPELYMGSGDVKYHLGYSSDYAVANGRSVHLSLCFNPSHLEYVNTVVLGRTRAKQDRNQDKTRTRKAALLIHGDAAFAGEGIVQETLNLSALPAYSVGGTVHVIINNQIGFTTPPSEGRSSTYATEVAKILQVPIFHVNGEDPEAVAQVVRLAMDFRQEFGRDVVIDMYGYRRHGHNESDEPAFTQPLLYAAIAKRESVRDGYLRHLLKLNGLTREEADAIAVRRREVLEAELSEARRDDFVKQRQSGDGIWRGYYGGPEALVKEVPPNVPKARLAELLTRQCELPDDFHPHRTLQRIVDQRREMALEQRPLDWGTGELLAFASLVTEGVRVRLTGQDAGRATFSQRHAVLHDVQDGHRYMPLAHLEEGQAPIEIYNSPLSEAGVMGFEYGYSLDWPEGLVLWEAQFGDFVNAAQVIIDQFIVSAEDKWNRLSGLVLLLPHGYEGMGPEHSSARIERFLVMAAEENIQLVQPTTPAQYFHCLRRQALRKWRKPLVVFTPKSLLRHPFAVSDLEDCATGGFQRMIGDDSVGPAAGRVLLCSGRIYFDLVQRREELGMRDVAIVRVEQFYPLPDDEFERALGHYRPGTPVIWVQDEPANMGAWRHLCARFRDKVLGRFPFSVVSRDESSSPATGSAHAHRLEQQRILEQAFAPFEATR